MGLLRGDPGRLAGDDPRRGHMFSDEETAEKMYADLLRSKENFDRECAQIQTLIGLHHDAKKYRRRARIGAASALGTVLLLGAVFLNRRPKKPVPPPAPAALNPPRAAGGKTLRMLLQERRRLDWHTALFVLRGTAAALQVAHARGVVHRDLNPANIAFGSDATVGVLGFSALQRTAGLPPYTAPEQDLGRASPGVDLYALSVVFYEMLTGELPFKGPNFTAQKREALYAPPSGLVKDLPPGIDAFFKAALAPEAGRRFPSAEALAAAAERTA